MTTETKRTVLVIVGLAALLILVLIIAGCSETPTPKSDLDGDNLTIVSTPWTVYLNYDEFPNIAVKCDGSVRLYATTRASDALHVIPAHELCQGGRE